jgi:hypothetical protein
VERLDRRLDRNLPKVAAEAFRYQTGVAPRPFGGKLRRHRHAVHTTGFERLCAQRGSHRRVDPARDPDDDLREAVLLDVVPEAEGERKPHLLELGLERRLLRQNGDVVGRRRF